MRRDREHEEQHEHEQRRGSEHAGGRGGKTEETRLKNQPAPKKSTQTQEISQGCDSPSELWL